jgi:hypothetical protein
MKVRIDELKPGDIVRVGVITQNGYDTATVKKVTDSEITFFRPYVHTSDFIIGNRVICYIGIEEFSVNLGGSFTYELVKRHN